MLCVFTTYQVLQTNVDAFLTAARPFVNTITQQPKLLYHDVFSGPVPQDPTTEIIRIVEVWNYDRDQFTSQQASSSSVDTFIDTTKNLIKSRQVQTFTRLDSWCAVRDVYLGIPKTMLGMTLTIYADKSRLEEVLDLLRQSWNGITGLRELQYIDVFSAPDPSDEKIEVLKLVEAWDAAPAFLMTGDIQAKYDTPYLNVAEEKKLLLKAREMEVLDRKQGWFMAKEEYLRDARRE